MELECRNPQWADAEQTMIDLEFNHPDYGWIPFAASPDDPVDHGRQIFEAASNGDYGVVADYVPPEESVV